ncbi:hypothetical protein MJO28_010721 [Puccinia striiformis f. sp. tritici]|uniref:Uncharacterized protein n=1 Tax=Puccinia striiformis f. sp. tritici TaxID=168172 RepID=A0ACC0E5U2_9BASI|nr:hypothetical protein Pst134EA_019541 [Puccinia striiformis f. sp. tritici]KAH9459388.1 hypothetical protein Pst134EA_019541 [Puccinia striiformis f. sp. tritici]KAI7945026.1 hypothetical protein MJO28_010721 [Puccinia striiformis f. sp. tritici]
MLQEKIMSPAGSSASSSSNSSHSVSAPKIHRKSPSSTDQHHLRSNNHHLINLSSAASIKPNKSISHPNRQPDKRQIELEDEHLYGPPSPRSASRENHNHLTQSSSTTSDSLSPITPGDHHQQHHYHSNRWNTSKTKQEQIDNQSTDELFLSECYPPIRTQLQIPFFNETLSSPIGMGRGQPIISPSYYSPAYGSVDRLWKRITRILIEKPYQLPELADTLSYPASELSINALSRLLEPYHLALPEVIKEHFLTHDGQDVFTLNSARCSGSAPLGIVWGLWLMSCEEVEAEWGFWRRFDGGLMPGDAFTASDFSSYQDQHPPQQENSHHNSSRRSTIQLPPNRVDQGMSSCPAGWVREVYSHPAWIPLLSDRVGNYIGVDLSPPPNCSYPTTTATSSSSPSNSEQRIGGGQGNARAEIGQVIAFGREIDEKVVLWRGEGRDGWAHWLASFADDLEDCNFARLIGKKSKPTIKNRSSSSSSTRRNSDGEGGWTHPGATSDDSEDTEDGLGDLGYFNDGAGFGGGAATEDGDFYGWRLAPEYRGMSVIEAICARSKQRWAEVGSFSSRCESVKNDSRSQSRSNSSRKHSPHLSGVQVGSSEPTSGTGETGERSDSSPPTPIAYVTPPSPRPPGVELVTEPIPATSPSSSSSVTGGGPGKQVESTGLHPLPAERPHKQQQQPKRSRVPPPAPVSLDLPTMDSLLLEADDPPPPPSRSSSSSSSTTTNTSIRSAPDNSSSSSTSTPKLVSRLSMVTQRISEEMSRRSSPILPSTTQHILSTTNPTVNTPNHVGGDNEAIGMVILSDQLHPIPIDHPPKNDRDLSISTFNHPSQGLGIMRTET